MDFSFSSVNLELEKLNEIDAIITQSFDYCFDGVADVMELENDKVDALVGIQTSLEKFAELQKDVSVLKKATEDMQSELQSEEFEKCNFKDISKAFDNVLSDVKENSNCEESQILQITSVKDTIAGLQRSDSLNDSELVITQDTEHYKDPITKLRIKNPYKNKTCGHYYDKQSILIYIERKNKKCPHIGCQSFVTKEDLIKDSELKEKLNGLASSSS